jgi:hypothetical protein
VVLAFTKDTTPRIENNAPNEARPIAIDNLTASSSTDPGKYWSETHIQKTKSAVSIGGGIFVSRLFSIISYKTTKADY